MRLSRRQLLQRSLLAGVFAATPEMVWAENRRKLPIPPLLDIGRGKPLRLDFRPTRHTFTNGKIAEVWGVNGHYLAPTVRVRTESFVKLNAVNNLPQSISLHIQGLLADSYHTDTLQNIAPSQSRAPVIPVQQRPATAWYYADGANFSPEPLYKGIAGFWLIEDNAKSTLPNQYGVNDLPLILQDVSLDKNNQLQYHGQSPYFGQQLLVNGVENAFYNAPRGWVRLRLLNASLSRTYHLQLDNGQPIYLIASGMGMLAKPQPMTQIPLVPNERIEILLDLNEGKNVQLLDGEKRNILDKLGQLFSDENRLQDNVILELRPEGMMAAIPSQPALPEFDLNDFNLRIIQERKITLSPNQGLINGQKFDPNRVDFQIKLGSVERWYLQADDESNFTLQGAKFIVETRHRQRELLEKLMWQDTLHLAKNQEATILVRFEQIADETQPFQFGVADFALRAKGAIGQFSVK